MPKPTGTRRAKPPELKVVVDSNAIYNSSASYLLTHEVYELICDSAQYSDLIVTWYLPETVRHERQHQMQERGRELVPPIQKLERLLGHNFNITEDIITQRVQEAIDKQLAELKIEILPVDSSKVDWNRIMLDATYRRPPFASGEKEKGFRDALICEAFMQLVLTSPTTPRVCRIALVTRDDLLAEAVKAQTAGHSNVRILRALEELKGLINTLVSEVSEDFIADIEAKATSYFFEQGQKNSLYLRENIWGRIIQSFSTEILSLPEGADERDHDRILIGSARFKRKDGQRVTWVTQIAVQVKAYKFEPVYSSSTWVAGAPTVGLGASLASAFGPLDAGQDPDLSKLAEKSSAGYWPAPSQFQSGSQGPRGLGSLSPWRAPPAKHLFKSGLIMFEITWSVSVSRKKRAFSKPTIESVKHLVTAWE